jgi:hypothetical protein
VDGERGGAKEEEALSDKELLLPVTKKTPSVGGKSAMVKTSGKCRQKTATVV